MLTVHPYGCASRADLGPLATILEAPHLEVFVLFNLLSTLLQAVAGLLGGVLLLRFWMQAIRVRPPYSLAPFLYESTDWLVKPLRRVMPGLAGYDWASLIGAIVVALLLGTALAWFSGSLWFPMVAGFALACLLQWIYYGMLGVILLGVLLSWVNPSAPMAPFIFALADPLLRPLRRIIPLIGNIDLSPMVALILLNVLMPYLIEEVRRLPFLL